MRYSIEGQELTDIADALRRRHGETEWIPSDEPINTQIATGNNGTGFNDLGGSGSKDSYKVISIPNAEKIKVKIAYNLDGHTGSAGMFVKIAAGNHETYYYMDKMPADSIVITGVGERELEFDGDTITFYFNRNNWNLDSREYGYYAECYVYGDIEVKKTFKSSEMAQAIDDIEVGEFLPEEAFVISGDVSYKFYGGTWDWFLNQYKDRITTKNLSRTAYLLQNSHVTDIPFELNFNGNMNNIANTFSYAYDLQSIPKINNCQIDTGGTKNLFTGCNKLRYIPEDIVEWFDWSKFTTATSAYQFDRSYMFSGCHSLRSIPSSFLVPFNPKSNYSYAYLYQGFNQCYALDELVDLPLPLTETFTSNMFGGAFNNCGRLKALTFEKIDGAPLVKNWKSQIIDLGTYCGYTSRAYILNYNAGITADKEVTNDETYQALKDDPDWFTALPGYSRYNHDSAVATINSLPDTSAYLATAGGTNTIKFKGISGNLTDGGAINTLTEEEIAVATAKGWTVSFV